MTGNQAPARASHRLTAALAAAGTDVQGVAAAAGVSAFFLYRVSAGGFPPSQKVLRAIASALGSTESEALDLCPMKPGDKPFPPCEPAYAALRAAGVSGSELARRSGIAPSNVSSYLTGGRRPTPKLMAAVEDATGLPREALFPHLFAGGAR